MFKYVPGKCSCLPGLTWLTVVSHLKALSRWPQRAAAPVANLSLITVVLPHGAVVCRDCTHKQNREVAGSCLPNMVLPCAQLPGCYKPTWH